MKTNHTCSAFMACNHCNHLPAFTGYRKCPMFSGPVTTVTTVTTKKHDLQEKTPDKLEQNSRKKNRGYLIFYWLQRLHRLQVLQILAKTCNHLESPSGYNGYKPITAGFS